MYKVQTIVLRYTKSWTQNPCITRTWLYSIRQRCNDIDEIFTKCFVFIAGFLFLSFLGFEDPT